MSEVDTFVERRASWSSNPLGDLLRRLGLDQYEREIVRSVGAHLSRHRHWFEDLEDPPGDREVKKFVAVATGNAWERPGDVALPDLQVGVDIAARVAAIEASAYPISEIAAALGISEDDLQHRIDGGFLLALHRENGGLALPAFQFYAGERLIGLSRVLREIRDEAPLALIEAFFTTPQRTLRDNDGRIWSPREWLAAGGELEPVKALARNL